MTEDEIDKFIDEESFSIKEEIEVKKDAQSSLQILDPLDTDEISSSLLTMVSEDRSLADKTFELFYNPISMGTDHSQASKESLMRAVELKIESSKNILKMLDIMTKKNQTGTNINFNGFIPPKKVGIDIDKIVSHIDDDNEK